MKTREITFLMTALLLGALLGGLLGDIIGTFLPEGAAKTVFAKSIQVGMGPSQVDYHSSFSASVQGELCVHPGRTQRFCTQVLVFVGARSRVKELICLSVLISGTASIFSPSLGCRPNGCRSWRRLGREFGISNGR
jgi:hypothetical protein